MEQASQESKAEEQKQIEFSNEYWVVELENRTLSHITKVENLDDNTKPFFDMVQSYDGRNTFMRFPKRLLIGMYKLIE